MRDVLELKPIGRKVLNALSTFLERDEFLLQIDANERAMTHRVALYLQNEFPDMNVDCEYNRDDHEPKALYLPGGDPDLYDTDAQTVYPDIIVHRRGTNDNLLVVEFKKTSSRVSSEKDFAKLNQFKVQLNYQYALFVEFKVGLDNGVSRVQWVDA